MTDPSNYNCCSRCGKVTGYANADLPPCCSMACHILMMDEGPVTHDEWLRNFNSSVVQFWRRGSERRRKKKLESDIELLRKEVNSVKSFVTEPESERED